MQPLPQVYVYCYRDVVGPPFTCFEVLVIIFKPVPFIFLLQEPHLRNPQIFVGVLKDFDEFLDVGQICEVHNFSGLLFVHFPTLK